MKLKSKQIRILLAERDKKLTWLAKRVGVSRSLLDYDMKRKNVKRVTEIALVLGVKPFDLIDLGEGVADGVSEGEELGKMADVS